MSFWHQETNRLLTEAKGELLQVPQVGDLLEYGGALYRIINKKFWYGAPRKGEEQGSTRIHLWCQPIRSTDDPQKLPHPAMAQLI